MSTDSDLVAAVKDDFATSDWSRRLQTVLVGAGFIGVGFLFGVGYYALKVAIALPAMYALEYPAAAEQLSAAYRQGIATGVVIAIAGIAGAVALDHRGDET